MTISRRLLLLLIPLLAAAQERTVILPGHIHPKVRLAADLGLLAPAASLGYVTVLLKPSPDLEPFLAEQQNPPSPNYHRWLTPEQFGARFGLGAAAMNQVVSWLQSEGLHVNDVARGRHWITFSGSAADTSRALHTSFHRFQVLGKTHYANVTDPAIPADLAALIAGFDGLNDFGLDSMRQMPKLTDPSFTVGTTHYLAPGDIATIYNTAGLYNAGFDGTGQKIVIVGRTDVDLADIRAYRAKYNLPANDPQMVLVGTDPGISTADLPEADLDLEWSGAVARNAAIIYVYSTSVTTSAQYAIDHNLAPVISESYGSCELETSPALRSIAQQANAQGITWLISSGDSGAAACDRNSPTPQAAKGAHVSFPASLPEVTAVGGTQFNEGAGTYWNATNGPNGQSAIGYIPEQVWNNSANRNQLSSGGGGASGYFPKPAWQTGPGVPNDGMRDVPDVAFSSSPDHDGYEFVTNGNAAIVGGTSVATPVFAGMIALVNQYLGSAGLGNINPVLYRMARSTTDVFHDVTVGDNKVPCEQSSPDCVNGLAGYAAGPGYDQATGLGSVDAYRLALEWAKGPAVSMSLTATPNTPGFGDAVTLTATLVGSGGLAPVGPITFLTHGLPLGAASLNAGGIATLSGVSAATIDYSDGAVTALFGGDANYTGASASTTVKVVLPPNGSAVVATINSNPVYEANGSWPYTVTLTEKAGIATTLTGFTVDGVVQNLAFFTSVKIPANGSISVSLAGSIIPPVNRLFHFAGMDADGTMWSRDFTVPFIAPLEPSLFGTFAFKGTTVPVQQNSHAPASCQWSHPLTIEERGGFLIELTALSSGSTAFDIQQLFGTTRLAPFGKLQGTVCWGGLTAGTAKTYNISGVSELGGLLSASTTVSIAAAPVSPAAFSVTPAGPVILQNGTATVSLNFTGGAPSWSAGVFPTNRSSSWLTVSPASGSGPAQLQIEGNSTGLSNGVYEALISIQVPDAVPQFISVPIVFVVGPSGSSMTIAGVANAASFATNTAPGMILSVFGTQLAQGVGVAPRTPLPLTIGGLSATVNGVTAPIYFTSPGQLNIQVPYETGAGAAVLGLNLNGSIAAFPFSVSNAAPGIFADKNGSLVPSATGHQGQILLAYITGEGDVTPSLATGAAPASTTAIKSLPAPRLPLTVAVGGVPATVQFAGVPVGLVGATQINFTVPPNAPLGLQPVVVTVGGVASPPVKLMVTAAP